MNESDWSKFIQIIDTDPNNLVILESLLVGYYDLHFKFNYTWCIIHINYEPVYSYWGGMKKQYYWLVNFNIRLSTTK